MQNTNNDDVLLLLQLFDAVRDYITCEFLFPTMRVEVLRPIIISDDGQTLEAGAYICPVQNQQLFRVGKEQRLPDNAPFPRAFPVYPVLKDGSPLLLASAIWSIYAYMPLDDATRKIIETYTNGDKTEIQPPLLGKELTPEQAKVVSNNLLTSPYLPMLNGSPSNDLMQINVKALTPDGFTASATHTTRDGNILTIEHFDTLQSELSTSARKIFDTAVLYLTHGSYFKGRNISPTVEIPLIEYGERNGYQLTPRTMATPEEQSAENRRVEERIKELKNNIRRDLRGLSSIVWSGTETRGRNRGDYKEMRLISSHSIRNGMIRVNFDIEAATYLNNAYIMQYPTALLQHDNRNPNAYVIGRKLSFHNNNDQNRKAGTESTLSVLSLLAAAPQIPSFDALKERGQRNWKDKIKKPLEAALDENISIGVISKWEYRDPKTGAIFDAQAAQALSGTQYARLMVDFSMVDAPEQTERRAAKAAAAEEQNKKKSKKPRKKA